MKWFYLLIMALVLYFSERKSLKGKGQKGGVLGHLRTRAQGHPGIAIGIGVFIFVILIVIGIAIAVSSDSSPTQIGPTPAEIAAAAKAKSAKAAAAQKKLDDQKTDLAKLKAQTNPAASAADIAAAEEALKKVTTAGATRGPETYTVSCASCPEVSFKHISGDYEKTDDNKCLVYGTERPVYKRKTGTNNGLGDLWLYAIPETDGTHIGWMIGGHKICEHSEIEAYVRVDNQNPAADTHTQIGSAAGQWWRAQNYDGSTTTPVSNWKNFTDLKIELKK
jgi:hypothetical protein